MISSHSIQHLPSKSFMTARLTKCSIQWYASPLQFVWYRGWVWERVESNAGQFSSFRFSLRPSLLFGDHGGVCRVLIKIVTRLRERWQDYLGVWSDTLTTWTFCNGKQRRHSAVLPCAIPFTTHWELAYVSKFRIECVTVMSRNLLLASLIIELWFKSVSLMIGN